MFFRFSPFFSFSFFSPLFFPLKKKKQSENLVKKAEKADLETKDAQNFRQVALVAEALLITYNRRRPGEVQALRYVWQ